MDFLVTPDGRWVVSGSADANAAIGYEDPDFDATGFAVRNLGFIQVVFNSPASITVRLHPLQTEVGALAGMVERSATFGTAVIELVHLQEDWVTERFASFETAGQRLAELCGPRFASASSLDAKYTATPRDLRPLFSNDSSPLKLLMQKWRVSFRRFTDTLVPFAIHHGVFSRMMIVSVKKSDPDPMVRYMGEAFGQLYGADFPLRAPGEKVANLPHKEYSAWAASFYSETAARGEPRYDVVEATLPQPATAGEQQHVLYERLLLPWETPSGETLVTLSSKVLKRATGRPAQATAAETANDRSMKPARSE